MKIFYHNFNLKGKILIIVLPLTALVFILTNLYFSIKIRENSSADSKEIANSETLRYANLIEKKLNDALNITTNLTDAFIQNMKLNSELRDTINKEILLSTLQKNKDLHMHYVM